MSYQIKKDSAGEFYFNLKAENGEKILTSEKYSTKDSAQSGIESVRANGTDAKNYEKRGSDPKSYFVLKAANGQIIGTSENYSTTQARDNGIIAVQRNCGSKEFEDLT